MSQYTPEQLASILADHAKWRRGEGGALANLAGANLWRADLAMANLSRAKLTRAYLAGADLSGANLTRADLSGANLTRADLTGAYLSRANLSRANLTGAQRWEEYTTTTLPALLAAGALPLDQLVTAEHWDCHSWENCPIAGAFQCRGLSGVPAQWRMEAERFITLFDAKALPLDKVREWCGLTPEVSK